MASPTPQVRPSAARIFWVLFLALACGITWSYRESFFRTAVYEEGDDAANALQIYRAKSLRELHGNYSRWGFHHPGPAFFYVYAAGEAVLHDKLRIAPAPRNAHLYAGALLQLAFYAAAVTLLARHARQPWLVAAVALVAGALHFPHVERIIYGVWPPDVLLMPFLCFLTACAALAAGAVPALPVVAVTGAFLVHGHVAQPLFVGPMALLAGGCAWRHWGSAARAVWRSRTGLLTLGLLALSLLPLGLDLLRGRMSNAHDILLHLRFQSDPGQGLLNAIVCYASYFIGLNDPTAFTQLTDGWHAPFVERWWLLAGWLVVLPVCTAAFFRRRTTPDAGIRFGRALLVCWLVGSVLTVVWGMRQDGGFTNFNSHFNHSLVHTLAFAMILALDGLVPVASRGLAWLAVPAAAVVFILSLPYRLEPGSRGDEVNARLEGLLHADPQPRAPKLLLFEGDSWYESVTVARALQRRGLAFYVHPRWQFMFGADHVLRDTAPITSATGVSVWEIRPPRDAPKDAHTVNRDASLVFAGPAEITRLPAHLDFSLNDHRRYTLFGIGAGEEASAWTDAHVAVLRFVAPPAGRDIALEFAGGAFLSDRKQKSQRVGVWANGRLLGRQLVGTDERTLRFVIPRELWNERSPVSIVLELPDAVAPATAGHSDDRRLLGLHLSHLSLAPIEP